MTIKDKDVKYIAQCPKCKSLKTNIAKFDGGNKWQNCIVIFKELSQEVCFNCKEIKS